MSYKKEFSLHSKCRDCLGCLFLIKQIQLFLQLLHYNLPANNYVFYCEAAATSYIPGGPLRLGWTEVRSCFKLLWKCFTCISWGGAGTDWRKCKDLGEPRIKSLTWFWFDLCEPECVIFIHRKAHSYSRLSHMSGVQQIIHAFECLMYTKIY